jgi:signal transduction histidine kinase
MARISALRKSGVARVWFLNIVLVALAVGMYLAGVSHLDAMNSPYDIPWWVLGVMFYFAELFVVHLQFRRNAHSFSVSEIPLVLGLFFVSPAGLLAAQVLGAGMALVLRRRQPLLKFTFNLALLAVQVCVAVLIFDQVSGLDDPVGLSGILITFVATIVPGVISAVAITLAIALSEGQIQRKNLVHTFGFASVATLTNTSLGLIGVEIMWRSPQSAWLLLIPTALLLATYRLYTLQRQEHESLEFLYTSTRLASQSLQLESILPALLAQARSMFRADVAEIVFFPTDDEEESARRSTSGPGVNLELLVPEDLDPTQGLWARVASEGESILLSRPIENERLKAHFAERNMRDAMVAPLFGKQGVVGMLTVANRLGDVVTFSREDLKLLETLANHASVSIENAKLVSSLEESLARLTEMNQLKDDFVAAVSHELRTPLTSIQGYVKTLLRDDVSFDADQQTGFLRIVERQSERLHQLIEDLLVASRLQSQGVNSDFATFSLPSLIDQVTEEFTERSQAYNFVVDIEDDLPFVMSDPVKVHQIVSNLLDNAFKYSDSGKKVVLTAERIDNAVVIAVADQGVGIPDDSRDKIFDRFYQVDQTATRSVGGTGLGLYICRRLADAIGGRVWLETSGPRGSVFCVSVPLRPVSPEDTARESEERDLRAMGA